MPEPREQMPDGVYEFRCRRLFRQALLNKNEIKTVSFCRCPHAWIRHRMKPPTFWEFSICLRILFESSQPSVSCLCAIYLCVYFAFRCRYYRHRMSFFWLALTYSHSVESNQIYLFRSFAVNNILCLKIKRSRIVFERLKLFVDDTLHMTRIHLLSTTHYAFHDSSNHKHVCEYFPEWKEWWEKKNHHVVVVVPQALPHYWFSVSVSAGPTPERTTTFTLIY